MNLKWEIDQLNYKQWSISRKVGVWGLKKSLVVIEKRVTRVFVVFLLIFLIPFLLLGLLIFKVERKCLFDGLVDDLG